MSPAATDLQPLQYFFHYDFDAFRMEIAGNLVGTAARRAYESWRTARSLAGRRPLVVDITYITEADEEGRAVLRSWQEDDARIVAFNQRFGTAAEQQTIDQCLVLQDQGRQLAGNRKDNMSVGVGSSSARRAASQRSRA